MASAIFPAEESDAIPSPMHVEYASIEWETWGWHNLNRESATSAESRAKRVGVVGAVASVSLGIALIA
jgi:hypothetical protein